MQYSELNQNKTLGHILCICCLNGNNLMSNSYENQPKNINLYMVFDKYMVQNIQSYTIFQARQ